MTYEDEINRGEVAHRLLNEPLLKEAFDTIRKELVAKWSESQSVEAREHYWRLHEAALMFERAMRGYVSAGNAAVKQLEHRRKFQLFK